MGAPRRGRLRTKTTINYPNGQRCVHSVPPPRVPATPGRPDQRTGHLTDVPCHVADHNVGVCAGGVQAGVGVVFGDAPQGPVLVPERGPGRVLTQEAGDPAASPGQGRLAGGTRPAPCAGTWDRMPDPDPVPVIGRTRRR